MGSNTKSVFSGKQREEKTELSHGRRSTTIMKTTEHGTTGLRQIPPMDALLSQPEIREHFASLGRNAVKSVLDDAIDGERKDLLSGQRETSSVESVLRRARPVLKRLEKNSLIPVVNATGVVVHTNLGRSCLAPSAMAGVAAVAGRYSTLEFDLLQGKRGHRSDHVEWLLNRVTSADASLVVNNNAGAVLLVLAALCSGREVIVSRGELVEIGGSFRIPEILAFSGAKLVEVGATNRTHLRDYQDAITEDTVAILKVHPSNFRIEGFASSVPRDDLSALARRRGILLLEDLGSGTLLNMAPFDLPGEPTVEQCLSEGVDLVTFSGDKMLGGPQIGVVAGNRALVEKLRTCPLLRALRVDKMTLAALEATLRLYLQGRESDIPTIAMLRTEGRELKRRASRLAAKIRKAAPQVKVTVLPVEDAVGGGAFPATTVPGWGVSVAQPEWRSATDVLASLRAREIPIVAGVRDNTVLFHVRTLLPGDDESIAAALSSLSLEE